MNRPLLPALASLLSRPAVVLLCALAPCAQATAQDPPVATAQLPEIARKDVEAALEALKNAKELDDATRARGVGIAEEALRLVDDAERWRAKATEFDDLRARAPERLAAINAELSQMAEELTARLDPQSPLPELEQELAATRLQLEAAVKDIDDLEKESALRGERRLAAPQAIAAARKRLEDSARDAGLTPAAGDAPEVAAAKRLRALARRAATAAEIAALEAELASYEARGELLTKRRDRAARRRAQVEKLLKTYQDWVGARRRTEARAAEQQAQQALQESDPALMPLAAEVKELARLRREGTAAIERVGRLQAQAKAKVDELESRLKAYETRARIAGLTDAIGLQLRHLRKTLPDTRKLRERARDREAEIAKIQLQVLENDERRVALGDLGARADELVAQLGPAADSAERERFRTRARELLESKQAALAALSSVLDAHLDAMVLLDTTERALLSKSTELARFIDERVLWIRSHDPMWETPLQAAVSGLEWLASPAAWAGAATASLGAALVLGALVLLVLLSCRRRCAQRVRDLGTQAAKRSCVLFAPTAWTALITLLLALPGPLCAFLLGWALESGAERDSSAWAVGSALSTVAWLYLALESLRQMCRSGGLAEAHFGWSSFTAALLRRRLGGLVRLALPLALLVMAYDLQAEESWKATVGRFAFVLALGVLALFFARVLHPGSGVLSARAEVEPRGFFARTRVLWFALGLLVPLALAVLACVGYYFAALQLAVRLQATLGLVFGLVVANALVLRGLLMTRRRLAIRQARERRAAREAASQSELADVAPEPQEDVAKVNAQTAQLLRSAFGVTLVFGAWLVWIDVLPALGILREVTLWQDVVAVTAPVERPDGTFRQGTIERLQPITLADLVGGLIVLFLTVVASRGLPGLLSLTVLKRLPIQEGERYAIATVARYTIIFVGVAVGFAAVGIGWTKVQWLIAAMGIGLGFGLQEIFANFISGLIILFERPVRVGDIVTVGDQDGKVARIRMRATTIVDWDRRELLIPNKEFITARVINWTLSDPVTRVVVPVGIAYGSDTAKARELLLKVARENPAVLTEPAPSAIFRSFGESSLEFHLRVFIPDRDVWPKLIDSLHTQIDMEFRNAGIEIAFPQRDIHIRSAQSLADALHKRAPAEERFS